MEQLTEIMKEQAFNHQESGYRPRRRIATDLMAFRSRVRELSKEAGTEMALERRAGLPVGSLSHYSRARPSEPTRPHLVALAFAMDVQLDWLCAGRGPKRSSTAAMANGVGPMTSETSEER